MRDVMMDLLRAGDAEGVAGVIEEYPRTLRQLPPRLWDDDPEVRVAAARAVAVVARRWPKRGSELVRRFVWGLNEESGTNGGAVVPALLAIARVEPAALEGQLGCLVARLCDRGLRKGLLEVIVAVSETRPDMVRPLVEDVRELVAGGDSEVTRLVASLARLAKEGT